MNTKHRSPKEMIISMWQSYKYFVEKATVGTVVNKEQNITYWRERLFTNFIIYVLPTCFIALIPGVYMALSNGYIFIGVSDMMAVISIAMVSLTTRLNLLFRKVCVALILYFLSILLIVNLSLLGPGILYLCALSVIITLIFPRYWGYFTVFINVLVCVFCAFVIHLRLFNSPLITDYSLGVWIAVSSNLVFLSFVTVMLISSAVGGLEKTVAKELFSKYELQEESLKRMKANKLLAETEDQYKSLFFLSPSPMWVLDEETLQFLQVNDSAIKQYGYTNEEFLSMNIKDIKMEKDMQKLHTDLQKSKGTGMPLSIITQHRRKNKELLYVEVVFNSIPFNGKAATLVISQDVTEQMNYISAIESQNKQFLEIAWIQSHKVRGPLATILGLAQLLNNKDMEVNVAEITEGILSSSEQLDHVIREIVNKTSAANIRLMPALHQVP